MKPGEGLSTQVFAKDPSRQAIEMGGMSPDSRPFIVIVTAAAAGSTDPGGGSQLSVESVAVTVDGLIRAPLSASTGKIVGVGVWAWAIPPVISSPDSVSTGIRRLV